MTDTVTDMMEETVVILKIEELHVTMEICSEGFIVEKEIFAEIGNGKAIFKVPNISRQFKLAEEEDKTNDEHRVETYSELLSHGRAVAMTQILEENYRHRPRESSSTHSYSNENITNYYKQMEKLEGSMIQLDKDAYHQAKIAIEEKQLSSYIENDGED